MTFNKLFEVVKDEDIIKTLTAFSSETLEKPYFMEETYKILNDNSVLLNAMTDSHKIALSNMLKYYIDVCYLNTDEIKVVDLLDYGELEIYKIVAKDGIRYATEKEVKQGVRGLIPETIYPAGEEEFRNLAMLDWSIRGFSYGLRKAGIQLDYGEDGKVLNTHLEILDMCAERLMSMIVWMKDFSKVEKAIKILKKIKRQNGYKYAKYAPDELNELISVRQLIDSSDKAFRRGSDNKEERYGLSLVIKAKKNEYKLTPYEISKLRSIYDTIASKSVSKTLVGEYDEVRKMCEKLKYGRNKGDIDRNMFVFKIIETLDKYKYKKVTEKQLAIIKEAYDKNFNNESKVEETKADVIDDEFMDISSISDAIGDGIWN